MGFLKEVFATGLADMLYRYGFDNIGKDQWEEKIIADTVRWVYVIGKIHEWGDKYDISVYSPLHSYLDPLASGNSPTIWKLKGYKSFEEALGVLTKHVRICQNKFPHLLFYREMSNREINQETPERKWACQEFFNNKWVTYPKIFYFNSPGWEPLRSVLTKCSHCNYFDDGWDDGDDEKMFSYDDNVRKCRKNYEFKCLQDKL
jgi:hypothetical protein